MKTHPLQLTLSLAVLLVLISSQVGADASVWVSAPKPKFPTAALRRGREGYVVVRTYIGQNGSVTRAMISKSSGDSSLDDAARTAVLKWKMNPAAMRPEYPTKGYEQRIDFRQEAPTIAQYRDRISYFDSFAGARRWIYAPAPEYPARERRLRQEGTVILAIRIGADGRVESVGIARSSGNANLDNAALAAVRTWRTHNEYAGLRAFMPVTFTLRIYRR